MNLEDKVGVGTRTLAEAVAVAWPEHIDTLERNLRDRGEDVLRTGERTAELVRALAEDELEKLVRGYRWMCNMLVEEELFFRRHGRYRNQSFADVDEAVYQAPETMSLYMDGLLLSQVLWRQHAEGLSFYLQRFLPAAPDGYRHLEVGPGHGILLYFAASDPRAGRVVGWDISPTSLDRTRGCLAKLGVERPVELAIRDVTAPREDDEVFDTIVISEVCEHLEDPISVLRGLRDHLAPAGRMYVNVPVNAPAVDHIYLLETPEAALEMVASAGLRVVEHHLAPVVGYDLAKARKRRAPISVAITAERA